MTYVTTKRYAIGYGRSRVALGRSNDFKTSTDTRLQKGSALYLDFPRGSAFQTFQKGPALYLAFPRGSAFQTFQKGPALYLAFPRGSAFQTFQKGPALYLAFADAGHLEGQKSDTLSDPERYYVPYPRHYKFILDDAHVCDKGAASPFLVLVVPVAPGNRLARDIIRQTWGKQSVVQGKLVQTVFLLGLPTGADDMICVKTRYINEVK
ncbi:unnamed protein product [Boreogadus saida]